MKISAHKIGVVVGLGVFITSIVPMMDLILGHCFYEQGCGRDEGIGLMGVIFASCVFSVLSGWLVAKLIQLAANRD